MKLPALGVICGAICVATHSALAAECPSGVTDKGLYYFDQNDKPRELPQDVTLTDVEINKPLSFFYVISSTGGAPDNGAILVKRIYQAPDDWADEAGDVLTRRRREVERPIESAIYDNYHRYVSLTIPKIRDKFHTEYGYDSSGAVLRTDDSQSKRDVFRYSSKVTTNNRLLAKPLIITWSGLSSDPFCLDFNLNERSGRFGMIEIYVYELQGREQSADEEESEASPGPLNTAHVKMTKTYE